MEEPEKAVEEPAIDPEEAERERLLEDCSENRARRIER
jgi:hypothetical protein